MTNFWKLGVSYKRFLDYLEFAHEWVWNGSQKCKISNLRNCKFFILLSNESILLFQKRSTCCMLFKVSKKLFGTFRVPMYEKWTLKMLIVSVVKFKDFKPQTDSKTPFGEPYPLILHLWCFTWFGTICTI